MDDLNLAKKLAGSFGTTSKSNIQNESTKEVLVVGESQCGKSSVIQLLSNNQSGTKCTNCKMNKFVFIETKGLDTLIQSKAQKNTVVEHLLQISQIEIEKRNFKLIMFVVKSSKNNELDQNGNSFEVVCQLSRKLQIPTFLVLTHCDSEFPRWINNSSRKIPFYFSTCFEIGVGVCCPADTLAFVEQFRRINIPGWNLTANDRIIMTQKEASKLELQNVLNSFCSECANRKKQRVLVFGEKHCGKSTIINMLTGIENPARNNQEQFSFTSCDRDGWTYVEITGLTGARVNNPFGSDDQYSKSMPNIDAMKNLINFIKLNRFGFSFLIFVLKSGHAINDTDMNNYKLFYEQLGDRQIPLLLLFSHNNIVKPKESSTLINTSMQYDECMTVWTVGDAELERLNTNAKIAYEEYRDNSLIKLKEIFGTFANSKLMPLYIANWQAVFSNILTNQTGKAQKNEIQTYLSEIGIPRSIVQKMFEPDKRRILVIGGSGVGKSSIIKLLTNIQSISISDRATGCTFECKNYESRDFVFADTTGLNEASAGKVPNVQAIMKLIDFLKANKEGFCLVVFVRKPDRITRADELNYELFYKVLNKRNEVPTILVLTNCEMDNPMNIWWRNNEHDFREKYNMQYKTAISICSADKSTIEAKTDIIKKILIEKREESKELLIEAFNIYSLAKQVPLFFTRDEMIDRIIEFLQGLILQIGFKVVNMKTTLKTALLNMGFSKHDANEITSKLK